MLLEKETIYFNEVELIMKVKEELIKEDIDVRVVSMPCMELFDAQSDEYKSSVLPNDIRARVAVEAGSPDNWYKYVGLDGKVIAMTTFGASGPFDKLLVKFGFTVENVVNAVKQVIK